MRTMHVLLGVLALGGGLALSAGCSSDPDPITPPTGTGGSSVGGGDGGTTTTTTTGGGGMGGDGNDSFETAEDILTDGTEINASLDPPATDVDFYKFTGNAGRLMVIDTSAKPENDPFSPAYVDLVVTLYNENQQQIAQNDDPYVSRTTNDSLLWTVLPDDGIYYIKVEECTHAFGQDVCAPVENITNKNYTIALRFADPDAPAIVLDAENGNDEATATTMKYVTSATTQTGYGTTFTYGFFTDANDVDVFAFTIPESPAPMVMEDLYAAFFIFGPEGPDGMGTTRNIGDAWITNELGLVISQIDNTLGVQQSARDIRAQVEPGQTYYLWVQHPGTGAGGHDFYIVSHVLTDTNPLEANELANNSSASSEVLPVQPNGQLESAFVTGELEALDVDHYLIAVPSWFDSTTDTVSVACGAHRSGSGVRDMMVTIFTQNAPQSIIETSMTETESEPLRLTDVDIGNETAIVVKVEGGTPALDVLSRFYQCGFHFVPGTP